MLTCRQRLSNGEAQPTTAAQAPASADSLGQDDNKPVLQTEDARYLRKRKLHMDAMFESAADS